MAKRKAIRAQTDIEGGYPQWSGWSPARQYGSLGGEDDPGSEARRRISEQRREIDRGAAGEAGM